MTSVAVVAHSAKILGGGLPQLRRVLAQEGVTDPIWHEVPKSRKAPKAALEAVDAGADLVFVWGGDGTVQRCMDALAGSAATVAVLPAGTANLFAHNLGIPIDLRGAVEVGLRGARRTLDLGKVNGEHFGVMAGTGFDAQMIKEADRGLKDRFGQLAYVWTGIKASGNSAQHVVVRVDGRRWYEGEAGCVLVGNVGRITGGLKAFDDAKPDDGLLEVGVITASSPLEWGRVLARMAVGRTERSPFALGTRGAKIDVRLAHKAPYQMDGGARPKAKHLKIQVAPAAITVCVPSKALT